jgi:nicotinic acid phosphoribosyltransferase
MAHSFIESFGTEQEAFTAFAGQFPAKTTFLVDTYDTEHGIQAAIDVIRGLGLPGPVGVRRSVTSTPSARGRLRVRGGRSTPRTTR